VPGRTRTYVDPEGTSFTGWADRCYSDRHVEKLSLFTNYGGL